MNGIIQLPRSFPSRYGAPVISRVDTEIFRRQYFTHCLQCTYCHDQCCTHGVDVDLYHHQRLVQHADDLEAYTGIHRDRWFSSEVNEDRELPGGGSRRTHVENGACVFLNREGRGCLIHSYCIEKGVDYHELKSIVDCLFPISFYDETLCPSDEIGDGTLICGGTGPSLYRGLREEVRYYFGDTMVASLDEVEMAIMAAL